MKCPNAENENEDIVQCTLISGGSSITKKNISCDICRTQWKDNQPPSKDDLTPVLIQLNSNIKYPGFLQQAANAIGAAARYITGGLQNVPDEIAKERMDICKICEYYDPEQKRCKSCGCFLELKVLSASEACPLQPPKWDIYEIKVEEPPPQSSNPGKTHAVEAKPCGCGKK